MSDASRTAEWLVARQRVAATHWQEIERLRDEVADLRDASERLAALTRQLLREHMHHQEPHHPDICSACREAAALSVAP